MTISQISSTQYQCSVNVDAIVFTFTLNKNIYERSGLISFNKIKGNILSDNCLCTIYCNEDIIFRQDFSKIGISTGINPNKSIQFDYDNNGNANIKLSFKCDSSIVTVDINDESMLLIDELYNKPYAKISDVTGYHTDNNGMNYVNNKSNLSIYYTSNDPNNKCNDGSKVYLEFISSGYSYLSPDVKEYAIGDNGGIANIYISIKSSDYEKLDDSEIYAHIVRTDNKGNKYHDYMYIGKFYIFPRFVNQRIYLSSSTNIKYDIYNNSGLCILFNEANSSKLIIDYDKIKGNMSGIIVEIYYGSELINSTLIQNIESSECLDISNYVTEFDDINYYIIIYPYLTDSNNYVIKYKSKKFGISKYIDYIVTGNDIEGSSGIPKIILDNYNIINKNSKSSINANSNITGFINYYENKLSLIKEYNSELIIIINNKELKICDINESFNLSIIDYIKLSKLIELYSDSSENSYHLFIKISGIIINSLSEFSILQHIGKLNYCPNKSIPVDSNFITSENKLTIDVDSSIYESHQYGIFSGYLVKISDESNIIVNNEFSDKDHYEIINDKFKSLIKPNKLYNLEITPVYVEDNINYNVLRINKEILFKEAESPGMPTLNFPIPGNYPSFGFYNKPVFYVMFKLPELINGTGVANEGDVAYSDIRVSINESDVTSSNWLYYSNNPNKFFGNLKYKTSMIVIIDGSIIHDIPENNIYTLRIQVKQNYNNVNDWGEILEVNLIGYKLNDKREYSGFIMHDIVFEVIEGFCKSYDSKSNINKYLINKNDIISTDNFESRFNCVMSAINNINGWVEDNKFIDDNIELLIPDKHSVISSSNNYIEQEYNWIKNIYNQFDYEPEDNFITIDNSDGTISIFRYIGKSESVNIPLTIDGKIVTSIE